MRFFANTGFLFAGLPIAAKLRAAALAGFDGVEFHDEVQRSDAAELADILAQSGLVVGSLNLRMGDTTGCAALPGLEGRFLRDMQAAHVAASAVGATAIHTLAGCGVGDHAVFVANLRRALDLTDRILLIEPISPQAIPGYALSDLKGALAICQQVGNPRLRVMFDWYHIATMNGGDAAAQALRTHRDAIGHVQLASVPDRAEPDAALVRLVADAGFGQVGLEYRPTAPEGTTLATLRQAQG